LGIKTLYVAIENPVSCKFGSGVSGPMIVGVCIAICGGSKLNEKTGTTCKEIAKVRETPFVIGNKRHCYSRLQQLSPYWLKE
jgi:hypothetical protein